MAKIKYGMQKPVQNELQQCINSFERMKRGGIGIADELVCDACKLALKYINELETKLSKLEPIRHGHWLHKQVFECSECGYEFEPEGYIHFFNYCPSCGAKMGGGGQENE